jgi:Tol biopolymer transport system component/DNA-binding winged helix-turn-helix (wHTH) protein
LNAPDNLNYEFGPFLLEPRMRRLSREREPVPLAAAEFELLLLLVRNHGRVVEKSEIMSTVWPDIEVEENNLTVRMSALRKALGESKGHHPYIQTVTGRGYCLTTAVKELPSQPVIEQAETVAYRQVFGVTHNGETTFNEDEPTSPDFAPLSESSVVPALRQKWNRTFGLYAGVGVVLVASFLVYVVLRAQKALQSVAPAQSMKMSRLTQTGRVQYVTLSPDGQNIAYVEQEGEWYSLWLQRVGTTNPLQLLPPAKLVYKDPAFTPNGHTLYYSKCQGGCQLYKMPVLGGVETALGIRATGRITFSPDGKRMAYARSDAEPTGLVTVKVFVANADGTGEEALNWQGDGRSYQSGAPAWSPDGKTVAVSILVTEGGRTFMKVIGLGVADRTLSTLISDSWMNIRDVAWVPDGSALIINGRHESSASESRHQIWLVSLTGGEPRRITNDLNNYVTISVSRDANTLIALQWQRTTGLSTAPVEDPSAAKPLTIGTLDRQDGALGLSVAPDGRLIYVSDHSGKRDLWSINADGTGLKQLTDGSHRDLTPVVSPDGRYIAFQSCRPDMVGNRDRAFNIWRVDADGRNPTQLTRGTYDSEPVFSPDSKWVVYVSQENTVPKLRKVPVEGGDSVPVTDEFSQHPVFSPDGKTLVYYRMNQKQRDQRHLVFIPAEGGAPIKTIAAPKNWGSIMQFAPAGDAIWYRDNMLMSIWVQPLDGAPSSLLLQLGEQQHLSAFCVSPDRRRLTYASGTELKDVVLITNFN